MQLDYGTLGSDMRTSVREALSHSRLRLGRTVIREWRAVVVAEVVRAAGANWHMHPEGQDFCMQLALTTTERQSQSQIASCLC